MSGIRCGFGLVAASVLLLAGCAHTAISGDDITHAQVIHGSVGIIGEDNELTVLADSRVTKLSIIGESNRVIVEDGARVDKVEMIGEDNEVDCPAGLSVCFSSIGEDNRLRRRSGRGAED
ncbi:MAG TPA: hypothetical protein VM243_08100 [Phycisphaerae bacterium]|nr:hypothetical protein [Phycisphaerae bacterium]